MVLDWPNASTGSAMPSVAHSAVQKVELALMLNLRLIVPAVPLIAIVAAEAVKAVAALRQMKEVKKIREVLEDNLGPITVKDKD